jgi:hypothetical protein
MQSFSVEMPVDALEPLPAEELTSTLNAQSREIP